MAGKTSRENGKNGTRSWDAMYVHWNSKGKFDFDLSKRAEADARAKMLFYLIENKPFTF